MALVVVLLGMLPARIAAAEPTRTRAERRASAEALFDEAKTLMMQQRHAEACPKFAESQALDPAVGTLLNLADCLEKLGRTASAWAEFRAAATAARAKGQTEREDVARRRAAQLELRLVRLTILPPETEIDGLEISKNGVRVGRGSWGVPLPVDPGRYVIEASAPGKQTFRTAIDVPAKPKTQLSTAIPDLEDSVLAPGRGQRIAGVVVGSVGIASIVAGSILGGRAIAQNAESAAHCNAKNVCDQTGVSLRTEAQMLGNASTAAFVIGAAAGVGGILLYSLAPQNAPAKVGVGAVGAGAGILVGGAF